MTKNNTGFLNDEDKMQFYASIAGYNMDVYWHITTIKIYQGAEILLYHYDKIGDLILDSVIKCTGFTVTDKGMRAVFVDRRDFGITTIGDVPNKVGKFDILSYAPTRCVVERTVKVTGGGKKMQGITSCVAFRSRSNPRRKTPGHIQAVPLLKARETLGHQYDAAVAILEN